MIDNGITIEQIQNRIPNGVLIYIEKGQKGPQHKKWEQTTFKATQNEGYQNRLRRFSNTGVLLGPPSADLIAIDFDLDEDVEPFLQSNRAFEKTLRTRGSRGCQFFAYMVGPYPRCIGAAENRGEWRGAGCQSVIRGIHPSGCAYSWLVDAPPVRISFSDLVLPDWMAAAIHEQEQKKAPPKPGKAAEGDSAVVRLCKERTLELCEKYLPNGVKNGGQWLLGNLNGDAGKSASIALEGAEAGAAYDFNGQSSAFILEVIARALGVDNAAAAKQIEEDFGLRPDKPEPKSWPEVEAEAAAEMHAALGRVCCVGSDWYICKNGVWQPRDPDEFRPLALKVIPPGWRTQRHSAEVHKRLESERQIPRSNLSGALKFGPAGEVLISTADCTLKLTPEGALALPTNPADGFTIALPIKWEPTAKTPLFEKVLAEAIEDEQDRELLLDVLATALIPDCRYEKALVLIGETGTGKSTIGAVLPAIFGAACASLSLTDLCHPSGYKLALLNWKAVNIGTELNTTELDDSGLFKQLVSGERFTARPIYGRPFEMRSSATLVFLANSMPRFRDGTESEARRICFIRFENQVENPDVTLKDRIPAEANGVFAMLIRRACELLGGRQLTKQNKTEAIERFCVSNDPVGQFVKHCCELGAKYECPKKMVYGEFEEFRNQHGISDRFDERVFFRLLYDRFPNIHQIRTGTTERDRILLGIRLPE